ncbi:butyrophilin subfamily 1 member A1-like isoform X2 [Polypterus senegalus]|nr:butyrophilin subfamily 1 member A1-like isoform X2 [Polypterus senegalus]
MKAYVDWGCCMLLFLHHTHVSWAETFVVNGFSKPIITYVGEDVILLATLSPLLNAEDFEVTWTRMDLRSPVLLYHDKIIISQVESYIGRVTILQEKLKYSNVSLIIKNIRVSDEGLYRCFVDSGQWNADTLITLNVEVLGAQPTISMNTAEDQQTTLDCSAEKWNPQPQVIWTDMNGVHVTSQSPITAEQDKEGLLRVSSVIPVKKEYNVFTCLMRSNAPKPNWPSSLTIYSFSPGISVWLVAFCILLILCMIVTPPLIIQWRKMGEMKRRYDSVVKFFPVYFLHKEIEMSQRVTHAEWRRICSSAVDVTLDPNTVNPLLTMSKDGKQVRHGERWQNLTDNPERFNYGYIVLAREGFASGRHYCEVQVGEKTKWTLGVARESVNRKGKINLKPDMGFWTVGLRNGNEYEALSDTRTLLPVKGNPRRVGVFLDSDEGQLSFYDAESRSHLYTFMDSFSDRIFPLLSPGINTDGKNADPLIICPVPTQ